ncbi:F0F1 ATP synthase subunit epsilon [Herbaspirillum sp. RV1423]|uniref:F0F1 ATP synthase subunit epsilon n=1 Tax=Herbaspirillum sp. RV1423 TaxID=1443993 RepID=UPI0004AE707F|nr:F0F1 ATP synthase subunit epsilon [Herbaspirillum sp. RV1423]
MKLRIVSPGASVEIDEDVVSLHAEDASGGFGIRTGHADFLTVLDVGVVSWRDAAGHERHCAVRRGVLRVQGGDTVDIASQEAIVDDDLEKLESTVLAAFRQRDETERNARTETHRLELQMLREIMHYLQPAKSGRGGINR